MTATVAEIVVDHKLHDAFDRYSGGFDPSRGLKGPATPYVGVPGSESKVCDSENHYFEMSAVHDAECHVRALVAELERLIRTDAVRLLDGRDALPVEALRAMLGRP